MRRSIIVALMVMSASFVSLAQSKSAETGRQKADEAAIRELRQEARRELREMRSASQDVNSLAPDDKCAVHDYASPTPTLMPTTTVFDPVWQITIPKNTVSNVIYPLLNNG